MIAEIQVLPRPAGTDAVPYANVHALWGLGLALGEEYEVGALGTTLEGPPDAVWAALRAAHEATLAAGAEFVISVVKLAEGFDDAGPTMVGLTDRYRT